MELREAIKNYLSTEINKVYKNLYSNPITNEIFVFNHDYSFAYDGDFELYNDDGTIIIDNRLNQIKYIPCSILSIVADRVEIPDIQILDAMIPIEMFVPNDMIDEVMTTLSIFQDNTNGKPISLKARYKEQEEVDYTLLMTFDLPDSDTFQIFNGINGKIIDFQIRGNITVDVLYGNEVEYELSIDDGNTFEKLVRIEPTSTLAIEEYSNQIVGNDFASSLPSSSIWALSLDFIVKKNSNLKKLLMYCDLPTPYIYPNFNGCNDAFLKIKYNFLEEETTNMFIQKDYYLRTGQTFIFEPYLHYSFVSETNIEILIGNSSIKLVRGLIDFVNAYNQKISIYGLSGFRKTSTKLSTELEYIYDSVKNQGFIRIISKKPIIFVSCKSNNDIFSLTDPIITIITPNHIIKPVLITSVSYVSKYADIITASIELKDRYV